MRLGTCLLNESHTLQGAHPKLADFCSATVAGFYSAVDIGGAGLVIAGTDLLAKKFTHPQIREFLAQFRQRVGAKKVVMEPVQDHLEIAAYVLAPRFDGNSKNVAKLFLAKTGGNWRYAVSLADACAHLMQCEGIQRLDELVIGTAATWMAGEA